jgi:DNA-binding IclR family transcriptional regulator
VVRRDERARQLGDLARWAGLPVGAALASLTSLTHKGLVLNAYGRWSLSLQGIREHRARMRNVRGA